MSYKSRTSDVNLGFLLLCVVVAVIVPDCNAACDLPDVQRCLPGIFGSNNIDSFRCSESGRRCIDNLRRRCAGSSTGSVISKIADLADYTCSDQGRTDLTAYLNCFQQLGATAAGRAQLNQFLSDSQSCANRLSSIGTHSSLAQICSASRAFESCIVSAFRRVCQNTAARRFFAKFADLVDVAGCFTQSGVAANIPYISKLSMAVWAGILGFFLTFKD